MIARQIEENGKGSGETLVESIGSGGKVIREQEVLERSKWFG